MRGHGQNQLKIYRLIPLLAALISLDSPFKFLLNSKQQFPGLFAAFFSSYQWSGA
jgi:hypothetical protein